MNLGEWWVENPWEITAKGHNLSCYERNRAYLNLRGAGFVEISHLTGADTDGDSRCAVAADFRNNGRLDLFVRQIGGGAVQLYENRFPQKHYLKVSLHGTKSNKLGIGARLIATVSGRQIVREMYPVNSYRSQAPNIVHFGLGDDTKVKKLLIRWPSRTEQVLTDLAADRHVVIVEGKDDAKTVVPGNRIAP